MVYDSLTHIKRAFLGSLQPTEGVATPNVYKVDKESEKNWVV